ncbi:MAG TPA: tRNA (adenosine(37)-N6)-dimethylallyltransferase MiaA [Deltaproteobacteria bacterium]|nr:tRNA (adenosine(37)-N6)-dimethylallyltransferase MiaA [Deltaproteobacteria bacterium]
MDGPEDLIVLTGPTCSGKTGLALLLAQRFPIEVVSADSMQVYRRMDIATAKPTPEQLSLLPHHLIDVVDPDEEFQAAMFVQQASEAIRQVRARGRIPLVVGGTGLYIRALLYGLAPAPARSEAIRAALRTLLHHKGISYLEAMLSRLDPASASAIAKNDAVRVVRALEIIFQSGRRASDFFASHGFERPLYRARIACIMPERERLFADIDRRTLDMVDAGLLDETRLLLGLGYGPHLRSMQTLAYRHVICHLQGDLGLDDCIRLIQRDTRRFAKRQVTWMKAREDHVFFDSATAAFDAVCGWLRGQPGE